MTVPDVRCFDDTDALAVGAGFYYVVKESSASCTTGSWQTVVGAEGARDTTLP